EGYADGTTSHEQLTRARGPQQQPRQWATFWLAAHDEAFKAAWFTHASAIRIATHAAVPTVAALHASLFRGIFGNPFRPVTIDPSSLTSTVVGLAGGIYADRAFDRLPILADALQDAGCDNANVLDHCRGPGPHVRGCWVVDLLLGKA